MRTNKPCHKMGQNRKYDSKNTNMLRQEYDKVDFMPLKPLYYKGLKISIY